MGLSPTTPATAQPGETLLEFQDNRLLIDLCGPHDRHLARIEEALKVHILRRGNLLSVVGPADAQAEAAQVLHGLYARLEKGRPVEMPEVEAALRMGVDQTPETLSPAEQLEMFQSGQVELRTRKKTVEPRTEAQKDYVRSLFANELAFGIGPAGTGKTYLAVASAVDAFERDLVERIILTRPAVEAGERLGFLPGDLTQKIDPYLRPLYDALYDLMGAERVAKLYEKRAIEIAPLAFMRGRTLNHAFVILDEAQNTTPEQMKMFLTRIGIGARAVVTGDVTQIDLPKGQKSGLKEALDVLHDVRGIAFTHFRKEDVVRHPLVARIVEAYENHQHTS